MKNKLVQKRLMGVWIDHREAIIVLARKRGGEVKRITSNVERQLRRSGLPPYEVAHEKHEGQATPPDDERQRAYTHHLELYYEAVIQILTGADSILLMGPGEAKGELNKLLAAHPHPGRIVTVETADQLTEPQLVDHVRRFFYPAKPGRAAHADMHGSADRD